MWLFFDLDGTLTNSSIGIVRCFQHALVTLGAPAPPTEELTTCVGPPLAESFVRLLRTDDAATIEQAIAMYRARYESVGIFENTVYPGIEALLTELHSSHVAMAVVTAKPAVYARRIIDHFGLTGYFVGIYGPRLGDRVYSKESLIRSAVEEQQAEPRRSLMIGDRAADVVGGKRMGLCTAGVAWGYGSAQEIEAANPDYFVNCVEDLLPIVSALRATTSAR